jgi:peptidoglycan/LPS O-acetylase OafA/YrhL
MATMMADQRASEEPVVHTRFEYSLVPNLDLVRSFAVISVLMDHTLLAIGVTRVGPFQIQYLGTLGVMLFFVLTTLVLMWSLERKPHSLDFYIRRFFRIYPLAIAAMLIAVLFHAPTGGVRAEQYFAFARPHLKDLLLQGSLMTDIFFSPRPALAVMWSLPYEVHMYLLLPILFYFVRRNFSLWPLMMLWVLDLLYARHVPSDSHNFAVAIGYFLPGVMAYVGFGRWKPVLPSWMLPVLLLCLSAVCLARFNFHNGWYFCLIAGLTLPLFRQIKARPVVEISRQIAKYSYGIYLTHPFALVIGWYLLRGFSLPVRVLGEVVPLIVLPVVAYHGLEHPMIRLGSRLADWAEEKYDQREMSHVGSRLPGFRKTSPRESVV